MPTPTVSNIYPSNNSTNIPIGIEILITFDQLIDKERAKSNIAIFGPDSDQTIGANSVRYQNLENGDNPYFLESPGYKGDLQVDYFFEKLNSDNTIFSGLDYNSGSPNYKTRVKIVPKKPLAPNTEYTIYIYGKVDDTENRGISACTVYDTETGSNTGSGAVTFRGGYKGTVSDRIVLEITEAGNSSNASYDWFFESTPSLVYSGIASRKYRSLIDTGIDVRFNGTDYQVGDRFYVQVEPVNYMETSYTYTFTTGTGSIQSIPSTTSTSVLDNITYNPSSEDFSVSSTTPEHKEIKISKNQRIIKIEFSNDIDPDTINDKTVKIVAHPATGYDPNVTDIGRLNKFMIVKDNVLYILLQSGEE